MSGGEVGYPFGALVGQEALKQALLLGAVDPSLGGVLIRGEKGTAKSTAARALARLLPPIRVTPGCAYRCDPDRPWADCPTCVAGEELREPVEIPAPHVDLPLGATEDRVLGTLDLERMLKDGRAALRPGLLAEAHRGVLYIDEVNLLADHLVDSLLDVATSGVNSVQRDGVSARHPARFLLVGSMNAEEGELRPQLLDRFGLAVEVTAPGEVAPRAEVVRRRLAFEADPPAFAARWAAEDHALGLRVAQARAALGGVVVPDGLLTAIGRLCIEARVDGLRADIALYKTSRALAALAGRAIVARADLAAAAAFVLPHRRRKPFDSNGLNRENIEQMLSPDDLPDEANASSSPAPNEANATVPPPPNEPNTSPPPAAPYEPNDSSAPSPNEPNDPQSSELPNEPNEAGRGRPDRVLPPGAPAALPRLPDVPSRLVAAATPPGKHAARGVGAGRGAFVRAVRAEAPRELAVDATLRSAILRRGPAEGAMPALERGDLHGKERRAEVGTLVLFVVDTSGSMGARRRTEAVKGAVLDLLGDAYRRRDRVAVVAARGPRAEVVLEATRSVEQAEAALRQLPTGGRTPLAHALALAAQVAAVAERDGPTLVVLLTDGRANVSLPGTVADPWDQALGTAAALATVVAGAVIFDTEEGFGRVGRAADLAAALGAEHLPLARFAAAAIRDRVDSPTPGGEGR